MRTRLILTFFVIAWLSLLVRIFYLSVQSNEYYTALSNQNTIKTELIMPVRGNIFDRNGDPVAINKLGFKIVFKPHLNTQKYRHVLEEELHKLVQMIPSLEYDELYKRYTAKDSYYNHNFIPIVDFIPYNEILPIFARLNLNEYIKILPASKRYYPYGKIAAHMIGYMSRATRKDVKNDSVLKFIGYVGKSGIEKEYNTFLQGHPGERQIMVSAFNEEIEEIDRKSPNVHHDITLSIDMHLQRYITELFEGQAGAVVVMSVDGSILAAGSYPEYDLNTFAMGISQEQWQALIDDINAPFTNKVTSGLYPPGSVIKTGLGLIYISSDSMSPWSTFVCNGSMELGNRKFRCWKHAGHGKTDIIKAIRESCDDYFYKGSLKVGIDYMSERLKAFGLGQKTGIDIPNEFIGTVPNRLWKRERYNQPWYIGETLNTSIGQGSFLVTPLQMTQFTALMAIGKLPKPHVAKKLGDKPVKASYQDVLLPREKKYISIIRNAMHEVCHHTKGTASGHITTHIDIAGKTGTAQVIGISQEAKKRLKEHEMLYYERSHAWLTTYGPFKKPQYVVTVLVEHGGHGGQATGEIVSKIYDKLDQLGYIKQ